ADRADVEQEGIDEEKAQHVAACPRPLGDREGKKRQQHAQQHHDDVDHAISSQHRQWRIPPEKMNPFIRSSRNQMQGWAVSGTIRNLRARRTDPMSQADAMFAGEMPDIYDAYLVPLIFQCYAEEIAQRALDGNIESVLETAAGTG